MDSVFEDESFGCVLTSPPYANCFDYSKVYTCELWLGDFFKNGECQREFRMNSVRSHVHARWPERFEGKGNSVMDDVIAPVLSSKKLWSNQIPTMLSGYFKDMGQVLSGLSKRMESNSVAGFVVGNSVYGGIPIATDLLIGATASRYGFRTEQVEIYRRIIPSSQQYRQLADREYFEKV